MLLKKRLEMKGKLDDEKMASLKRFGDRIKEIDTQLETDSGEKEFLEEELTKKENGKIIAENIVYPA